MADLHSITSDPRHPAPTRRKQTIQRLPCAAQHRQDVPILSRLEPGAKPENESRKGAKNARCHTVAGRRRAQPCDSGCPLGPGVQRREFCAPPGTNGCGRRAFDFRLARSRRNFYPISSRNRIHAWPKTNGLPMNSVCTFNASAVGADARRRDAGDGVTSSRSARAADAPTPLRAAARGPAAKCKRLSLASPKGNR
jgi:hypothetical protein